MTSPDPTAGTVLGEEARLLQALCVQLATGGWVQRPLDDQFRQVRSLLAAAREAGREEGRAELADPISALVAAAMETAIGWSGEPEGAPTVDAMDLHSILYPAPPPPDA